MGSVVYLGCVLLILSVSRVKSTPVCNVNPQTDATVLQLEDINTRLNTIEGAIGKISLLSNKDETLTESSAAVMVMLTQFYRSLNMTLHSIRKEFKEISCVTSCHRNTDDIVEAIRYGHFKKAEEKLIELGETANITQILDSLYNKCDDNFNLIVEFAKGVSDAGYRSDILDSLHQLMMKSGRRPDTINLIILTSMLERQAANPRVISELKHSITWDFRAHLMGQRTYYERDQIQEMTSTIAAYLPDLSDKVIKNLIDDNYEKAGPRALLSNLCNLNNTAQAIFAVTHLYWRVTEAGNYSSSLMLEFAYNLAQLQDRTDFDEVSKAKRDAFDSLKANIPTCAANLFFEPKVCLWNVGTQSYLIAANSSLNYDKERRNIFTTKHEADCPLAYKTAPHGSSWSVTKVYDKIFFKSSDYADEHLYASSKDHQSGTNRHVFLWIPGDNKDDQSAWKIELDGENCSIKNAHFNEYLYASEVKSPVDDQYSYAFTWKEGTLGKTSDFLWQVRGC